MIERIVAWSAGHKFVVLASFVLIAAGGVWAIRTTPLDAIPDLSENQVIVFSEYMGRSPQVVEDQITFPLVRSLEGLPNVKGVRAQSMFGMSFIYVIFNDDVDLYWARTRVLERLATVQSSLPTGSKTELGPDGTGVGHVYWYTLEADGYDLGTLRAIQDWFVKPQLQAVDGVAEVASVGGFVKEYQVNADPRKLATYGFTLEDLRTALMRSNNAVGGRILEVSDREHFVRGEAYLTDVADFERVILGLRGGVPISLRNVADITVGAAERRGSLDWNGTGEVVGGIVVMRAGENAKNVIDRVKQKLEEIKPGLPHAVSIVPAYDRSELISASVDNLIHTLIEEAIIVTLIVLLFLFHLPSALRIVVEIPISVLIAFILMRLVGISSNIMSLGGIAIGIGVLVDASIVMLENAHRHLAEAEELREREGVPFDYGAVVLRSAQQVARPIFFSLLIIIVSFLPVFLLTGQEGKLFHPLAFTKTFSLVASAVVSITLVPVLMTLLMKGHFRKEERNPLSRFFIRLYLPVLRWALKHRAIAIGLNVLALVAAIPIAMNLGSEFMPSLDENTLLFMPTMLPNVSLPEATRIMQTEDSILKSYPEVAHVLGKVGKAETATDPAPVSMIETIVQTKPRSEWRPGVTKDKLIADLSAKLRIPGVAIGWTQPIINRINMLSTGVRTDLGVKFFGENLDTLEHLAVQAESILKTVPGAADVVAERTQGGSFLDISIDQKAALSYGINASTINDVIESAIGGANAGTVIQGRSRFPIVLRYQQDFRGSIEAIRSLPVPLPGSRLPSSANSQALSTGGATNEPTGKSASSQSAGGDGMSSMGGTSNSQADPSSAATASYNNQNSFSGTSLFAPQGAVSFPFVPLSQLATVRYAEGPPMIASENGLLRSIVYLNVRGRDMGGFAKEAQEVLRKQIVLPAGYTISWSGEYEQQQHAKDQLGIMIPLVFVIIFILLFMTLRDVREAGVVMLSVPFALIGGVFLIALLGYNWSVAVWVGFIALYGVAVETGVVMVVYLHEALDKRIHAAHEGLRAPITLNDIYESTVDGAALRLRPKLMTVAVAMLGLVPILWSEGVGSDVMRPIAAPMIGGMVTSAIHVLIITPILFYAMKAHALKKGTLGMSKLSGWIHH